MFAATHESKKVETRQPRCQRSDPCELWNAERVRSQRWRQRLEWFSTSAACVTSSLAVKRRVGETIGVLTSVFFFFFVAVNACVNLPAQTALGLWSQRAADSEHSLLAAGERSLFFFFFFPQQSVMSRTRRASTQRHRPRWNGAGPPLNGCCVTRSPAPNKWCNRLNIAGRWVRAAALRVTIKTHLFLRP